MSCLCKNYLLVWDIDGTLINSKGIGKKAMNRAFYELYGIHNAFEGIDMAGMLDYTILQTAFARHCLTVEHADAFYTKYVKFLQAEIENLTVPIVFPGILTLLEILSSKGNFFNVLGTGNIEKGARIKLSRDGLNSFFPTGGFSDKETERWQVIEKAVANSTRHFGITFEKENIYVIGDTPKDIKCGKVLGAKTVGAATGQHTTAQLEECGADHVFENLLVHESFLKIFN
jgi:phosphoglycolate phosphatase-like HAD superfamily hydrolase